MDPAYLQTHKNRTNLLIHIVAVPLFASGLLGGLVFFAAGRIPEGIGLLLLAVLSLTAQGRGHKLEETPPEPFRGPGDFVRRILTEQYVRFWVFVARGHWLSALKNASSRASS